MRDYETIRKTELQSIIRDAKARGIRPLINFYSFRNLPFKGDDLSGVEFRECEFPHTTFAETRLDDAIFKDCSFTEKTRFYRSSLRSVRFTGRKPMDVAFDECDLAKAWFRECALHSVDFTGAELYRTRLSRSDFEDKSPVKLAQAMIKQERDGEWAIATEVYRLLKENFASLANHKDASWAHFKEMQMLRKSQDRRWRSALQLVNEITWGYGEKPERPLFLGIGIITLWALIYWALGSMCGGITGAKTIWDYLLFSAASFVTMSFQGLEAVEMWVQVLSTFEATIGVITLSMFTFAIGQRMSG